MLLGYAIPYAFLGMYGDAAFHTMALYLPMLTGLTLLCFIAIKTRNVAALLAGNALSFISSHSFTAYCSLENWSWYFKPFTPFGFLKAVSILALSLQVIVLVIRFFWNNTIPRLKVQHRYRVEIRE